MYKLLKENTNDFIAFNYNEKKLVNNEFEIILTSTETNLLYNLCESRIHGEKYANRDVLERMIWHDSEIVDRSSNLNQVTCTLRKKISLITKEPIILTAPKKGYFLDTYLQVHTVTNNCEMNERKRIKPSGIIKLIFITILTLTLYYYDLIILKAEPPSKIEKLLFELFIALS